MESNGKCPVMHGSHASGTTANQHWWPNQLNLKILHQNSPLSDPMGKDFNYAEEFKTLDLDSLKKGINELPDNGLKCVVPRINFIDEHKRSVNNCTA